MMGRLLNKMLFSTILYAAGFGTAIYLLVPSPTQAKGQSHQRETTNRSIDAQSATGTIDINSQEWVLTVRTGIDTCIDFAEEYALRAADLIRSKMGQGTLQSD